MRLVLRVVLGLIATFLRDIERFVSLLPLIVTVNDDMRSVWIVFDAQRIPS